MGIVYLKLSKRQGSKALDVFAEYHTSPGLHIAFFI